MADWNDVAIFLEVHRAGSLSAAARALRIDQTTAGRRLKALERALGAKLLRLTANGAALTDVGAAIVDDAAHMQRAMRELERKATGRDAEAAGTVRIATTEALASSFLIPRLALLRARHPALAFDVITSNAALALARGDADLALRLVRPAGEGLVMRKVGAIELGVFAAKTYLAARGTPRAGNLAGHDILGYHSELANGPEAQWLRAHASQARTVLRVNSVLNLVAATIAGMGIAVLPTALGDDPALQPLALGKPPEGRGVWICYHRDLRDSARIKLVIDDLAVLARDPTTFPRARRRS